MTPELDECITFMTHHFTIHVNVFLIPYLVLLFIIVHDFDPDVFRFVGVLLVFLLFMFVILASVTPMTLLVLVLPVYLFSGSIPFAGAMLA